MSGDKNILVWVCFYKNCITLQIKKLYDVHKIALPMTKLIADDEIRAFDGSKMLQRWSVTVVKHYKVKVQ
jgi:hypothetical protein